MNDLHLTLLSVLALTCLGASITSNQVDAEHAAPTSSKHDAIGDYVAAGLGMSTRETAATLAVEPSDNTPEVITSSSQVPTFSNTSTSTTVTVPSGDVSITAATVTTTPATDCWHSWLDYWSASSTNQATYTSTSLVMKTATREVTKYWKSLVQTTSYFAPRTIYSDGYPVSVSTSYSTFITSIVGWDVAYGWDTTGSLLSAYLATSTETWSEVERLTISRPVTVLPVPSCELPAAVPECSMQWSSYIRAHTNIWADPYYVQVIDKNSTSWTLTGAPDCTQAEITGDWCTSMRSFYLYPQSALGDLRDPGWETTSGVSYFPASRSIAPGCSLGCQACSITGESVQLLYWPPETAAIMRNSTELGTLTPFTQNGSSVRTTTIDGTVLTSPTIYISYDLLYAADSCGAVGKTYRNKILPLSDGDHLFSLEKVVPPHGFSRGYYTSSFNFTDLIEPIPNSIYDRQERCKLSSMEWFHGLHMTAGFSCARTASYAPIIEVPPEARALDPAWSSCQAWYGGLFDPPRALQPANAIVVPTPKSHATTTPPAATPQPTVDSGLPTKTPSPATSKPRPQVESSKEAAEPTSVSTKPGNVEASSDLGDASRIEATKANSADEERKPQASQGQDMVDSTRPSAKISLTDPNHDPVVGTGSTNPEASSVDGIPELVATSSRSNAKLESSKGVAIILSILVTKGSQSGGVDSRPQTTPVSDSKSQDGQGLVVGVTSEDHTELASQSASPELSSVGDGAVVESSAAMFHEMRSSATKVSDAVTINGDVYSASALPDQNDAVLVDGHTLSKDGTAATIRGQVIAYGSEGLSVLGSIASVTVDDEVYAASTLPNQFSTLLLGSQTLSQGGPAVAITHGSKGLSVTDSTVLATQTFIAESGKLTITLDGTPYTATPIPGRPDAVILQGQTLSIGGSGMTVASRFLTKGSNGISVAVTTSTAFDDAETPEPATTADMVASSTSAIQESPTVPGEESSGSKHKPGTSALCMVAAMMILMMSLCG